jgi:hypothetical protein
MLTPKTKSQRTMTILIVYLDPENRDPSLLYVTGFPPSTSVIVIVIPTSVGPCALLASSCSVLTMLERLKFVWRPVPVEPASQTKNLSENNNPTLWLT